MTSVLGRQVDDVVGEIRSMATPLHDRGDQTVWAEVANDAGARIESHDRRREVPVTDGVFLYDDWHVPVGESVDWPRVIGYLR